MCIDGADMCGPAIVDRMPGDGLAVLLEQFFGLGRIAE